MPAASSTVLRRRRARRAFNGFLVTRMGLPSLAVTIGTLTLYRGIAVIILGPTTISTFPARYTDIGVDAVPTRRLRSCLLGAVLRRPRGRSSGSSCTRRPFGRSLFAIGANQEAALFAGIRVKRTKFLLFIDLGHHLRLRRDPLHVPALDRRPGQRPRARAQRRHHRAPRRLSIFGGPARSSASCSRPVFAGLQSALLLTNFNQQATGVVTGSLLLISVLIPNASSFAQRGRDFLRRRQLRGAVGAVEKESAA